MKIGCCQVCINPEFPVNRMLGRFGEKHQAVSDDLHCRIIAADTGEGLPFYHVSIDTVELWKAREDAITAAIEDAVGHRIHCICSATHSHNCPCMTTDDAYVEFVIGKIREAVSSMEMKEYSDVRYAYSWEYFDQVGKSRVMDYATPHVYAEVLSIYGDGKRILSALIHNVHPTTKDLWVGDFTAEYPGYCIQKLREEYPGEFFTFLLGPAGDTSPHFVRRSRDYAEEIRLADLLKQEFDRQLKRQDSSLLKPLKPRYEETVMPKITRPFHLDLLDMPAHLNPDEQQAIAHTRHDPLFEQRQIRDFENVQEYHFGHLILSADYSIIFEPFELYSEYYGAVDKQTCTIASISHGFEHYLTGLYLDRISMHGSFSEFSDEMRKQMWHILSVWSCQEELKQ